MRLYHSFFILLVSALCNQSFAQDHANHSYGSIGYADSINKGLIGKDTMKSSVHRTTMLTIGGCHMHVEYSSPGVRDRTIWGALVPYDEVWVTGAHNATSLQINKSINLGGKSILPGTYAIFTIPGRDQWTFILNKNPNQHQADEYKVADDLVRLNVKAEVHSITPRLTYAILKTSKKSGSLIISWENVAITVPFEVL